MIKNISKFFLKTELIYGAGSVNKIIEIIKHFNKEIYILIDPALEKKGVWKKIDAQLKDNKINNYNVFYDVESQPTTRTVEEASEFFGFDNKGVLIAIGGGSTIDTAKAVSMKIAEPNNKMRDFFGLEWEFSKPVMPIIAIPTTAGTGSEVTHTTVITDKETNVKMGIRHTKIIPKIAILDHELLSTIPPKMAAITGIDALTHALEAFICNIGTPITDAMSLSSIKLIFNNLKKFVSDPENNHTARENMLLASLLAGISITNAGVCLGHVLAAPLGVKYHLSHGEACAISILPILKYNFIACEEKYAEISEILDSTCFSFSYREKALHAIKLIKDFMDDLEINYTFRSLGIDYKFEQKFVDDAITMKPLGWNPRKINRVKLTKLFESLE